MSGVEIRVRANTAQARRDLNQLDKSVKNIETSVSKTITTFRNLALGISATFGAARVITGINNASDSIKNLENRVNLVTKNSYEAGLRLEQLFDIAARSRTKVEGAVEVFNRFGMAMKDIDASRLLQVTEAIQKATVISGASAESANAALIQLGQGLAANELRGQELNSVREQIPRVAQAIADGLGVELGALKSLAEDGVLTAETVLTAIESQIGVIDEDFDLLGKTITSVSAVFKNEFTAAIREVDRQIGVSNFFVNIIESFTTRVWYFRRTLDANLRAIKVNVFAFTTGAYIEFLNINNALDGLFGVNLVKIFDKAIVGLIKGSRRIKEKVREITQGIFYTDEVISYTPFGDPIYAERDLSKTVKDFFYKNVFGADETTTKARFRQTKKELEEYFTNIFYEKQTFETPDGTQTTYVARPFGEAMGLLGQSIVDSAKASFENIKGFTYEDFKVLVIGDNTVDQVIASNKAKLLKLKSRIKDAIRSVFYKEVTIIGPGGSETFYEPRPLTRSITDAYNSALDLAARGIDFLGFENNIKSKLSGEGLKELFSRPLYVTKEVGPGQKEKVINEDSVFSGILSAYENVSAYISSLWSTINFGSPETLTSSLVNTFTVAIENAREKIKEKLSSLNQMSIDYLGKDFSEPLYAEQLVGPGVTEMLPNEKSPFFGFVKMVDGIKAQSQNLLGSGPVATIKQFVEDVKGFFQDLYDTVIGNSSFTDLVEDVNDKAKEVMEGDGSALSRFEQFKTKVKEVFENLKNEISRIFTLIVYKDIDESGQGLEKRGIFKYLENISKNIGNQITEIEEKFKASSLFDENGKFIGVVAVAGNASDSVSEQYQSIKLKVTGFDWSEFVSEAVDVTLGNTILGGLAFLKYGAQGALLRIVGIQLLTTNWTAEGIEAFAAKVSKSLFTAISNKIEGDGGLIGNLSQTVAAIGEGTLEGLDFDKIVSENPIAKSLAGVIVVGVTAAFFSSSVRAAMLSGGLFLLDLLSGQFAGFTSALTGDAPDLYKRDSQGNIITEAPKGRNQAGPPSPVLDPDKVADFKKSSAAANLFKTRIATFLRTGIVLGAGLIGSVKIGSQISDALDLGDGASLAVEIGAFIGSAMLAQVVYDGIAAAGLKLGTFIWGSISTGILASLGLGVAGAGAALVVGIGALYAYTSRANNKLIDATTEDLASGFAALNESGAIFDSLSKPTQNFAKVLKDNDAFIATKSEVARLISEGVPVSEAWKTVLKDEKFATPFIAALNEQFKTTKGEIDLSALNPLLFAGFNEGDVSSIVLTSQGLINSINSAVTNTGVAKASENAAGEINDQFREDVLNSLSATEIANAMTESFSRLSDVEIVKGEQVEQVDNMTTSLGLLTEALGSYIETLKGVPSEYRAAVPALGYSMTPGYSSGGYISGSGGPTDDMIPARLSNGEFVVQASAVKKYGRTFMDSLNSGRLTGFVKGTPPAPQLRPGSVEEATGYTIEEVNLLIEEGVLSGINLDNYLTSEDSVTKLENSLFAIETALTENPNDVFLKGRLIRAEELLEEAVGAQTRAVDAAILQSEFEGVAGDRAPAPAAGGGGDSTYGMTQGQAFLADVRAGFKEALKTGNFKEFGLMLLDSFTSRVVDSFVDGFADKLFEGMFGNSDNIFDNLLSMGGTWGEKASKSFKDGAEKSELFNGKTLFGDNSIFKGLFSEGGALGGIGSLFSSLTSGLGNIFGSLFGGFGSIFSLFRFSSGGIVPSTPYSQIGKDSVPAMLTPGELVVPANQVNRIFKDSGQSQQVYNINVSGDVSRQTRKEIVAMIPQITQGVNMTNKERGRFA